MHRVAFLALLLTASAASAKIPDFNAASAPDIIRKDPNPQAREFYAELLKHSKKEGRRMVEDTKKTTGLKASDLKTVDWDCLFWRVAASVAKNIRRTHPGLQPPEFADLMEKTALDEDDCPEDGGPGSNGVKVYNAAINQVQAGRDGWQRSAAADFIKALTAMGAVGGASIGTPAPVTSPAGLVPLIGNPENYMPRRNEPKPGDVL